jgi:hypothetical protein
VLAILAVSNNPAKELDHKTLGGELAGVVLSEGRLSVDGVADETNSDIGLFIDVRVHLDLVVVIVAVFAFALRLLLEQVLVLEDDEDHEAKEQSREYTRGDCNDLGGLESRDHLAENLVSLGH